MQHKYFDLKALTAAAACDCEVYMHLNAQNKPVFSVGNSNTGALEFSDYFTALQYLIDSKAYTAGDVAEQAGYDIASRCLDAILSAKTQAAGLEVLMHALLELQRLPHTNRAVSGFAVALVNIIEVGLQNLPKGVDA